MFCAVFQHFKRMPLLVFNEKCRDIQLAAHLLDFGDVSNSRILRSSLNSYECLTSVDACSRADCLPRVMSWFVRDFGSRGEI